MTGPTQLSCLLLMAAVGCNSAPAPPSLEPTPPNAEGQARAVRVAGLATATPLIARLARAFEARHPGPRVVVDAPLSARGAKAALSDGALDGAIIGAPEGEVPPNATRVAATRPSLAVGAGVRTRSLDAGTVRDHLEAARLTWPDGLPVRVLLRPLDDPLQRALVQGRSDLEVAFREAVEARRFRVLAHDADLRQALQDTPGAIGVTDLGAMRMHGTPLWPVHLEGVTVPRVDLWLGTASTPPPRLQAFLAFVEGAEGRALVVDLGYEVPR